MKNVLVINAHQAYEGFSSGRLTQTMIAAMTDILKSKGCELSFTTIEQGYDVLEEVEKHLWADLVITQSPVYWCALPWQHKKYIEEVFNAGLSQQVFVTDDGRSRTDPMKQYGSGGRMQGKQSLLSLTWNAPEEAFDDPQQRLFQGRTVDDLFTNTASVYRFCGVETLAPFSCFNVIKAPDVENDITRLTLYLEATLETL